MADQTIAFTVDPTSIQVQHQAMEAGGNNEVNFTSNQQVFVVFAAGKWPFTQPEGPITVNPGTGAGPYTLTAEAAAQGIQRASYEVGTELTGNFPTGITISDELDMG